MSSSSDDYEAAQELNAPECIRLNLVAPLLSLIDECQDENVNELIAQVSENSFEELNETLKAFIQHPKIRQSRPENCLNDCTTLDQHFFKFCCGMSLEALKFFEESGVTGKKLIGSGVFAVVPTLVDYPCAVDVLGHLIWSSKWTSRDFESIFVCENYSLYQYFMDDGGEFSRFGRMASPGNFQIMHFPTSSQLLYGAVIDDNDLGIHDLIAFHHADPNFAVDGKTLLFYAYPKAAEALLNEGADPAVESDGLLFYERNNFFQNAYENHHLFYILLELYKNGFDLFSRDRKTGKSFVDYLNPEAQFKVLVSHRSFLFPVKKLCIQFFEILKQEEVDCFAPIDPDNNSVAHYFCSQCELAAFHLFSLSALTSTQNKDGKTPLRLFIENDKKFEAVQKIREEQDFFAYLAECESVYGKDFYEKHGKELLHSLCLSKNFNANFFVHLIEERQVALDESLGRLVIEKIAKFGSELVLHFLDCKYPGSSTLDPAICIESNFSKALLRAIDDCKDEAVNELIAKVSRHIFRELNGAFKAFIQHPKIRNARPENCSNDCTTLDRHYFDFCFDCVEIVEFLHEAGVDGRRLVGSGLYIGHPNFLESYDSDVLYCLLKIGWTAEDFESISLDEQSTLWEYLYNRSFFDKMSLDEFS